MEEEHTNQEEVDQLTLQECSKVIINNSQAILMLVSKIQELEKAVKELQRAQNNREPYKKGEVYE